MRDIIEKITCTECKTVFELIEKHADGKGWERDKIVCPYCDHTYEQITPGYFETSKLPD